MPDTVKNPVLEVYTRWSAGIEPIIGKGNYSMDSSSEIAKTPYIRIVLMGNPGMRYTLAGDESATNLSFQVETFTSGQKALSKIYDYDEASHNIMTAMGFRRTYGPELIENVETKIKRLVSRYSRLYTGYLLKE